MHLPLFPYYYRALPSQKELGGLCYRYRTFSAWVQWEHSGSLSQIGFKCMFASRLLSLASFSHWLLQQRLSLFRKENDAPPHKRTRSFHGTENIECVQWGCSKLFRESQMHWSTWGPQTSHYEQTLKNVHKSKKSTYCEKKLGITREKGKKTGRRWQCVRGKHRTVNCSLNSNLS